VEKGYPELPGSYSARFGDAIHNYRCVLDHIAWQLVKHGTDPDPSQPASVQFPIYRSKGAFESNIDRRLPGVADIPRAFIKKRQDDAGWDNPESPLQLLAGLSNDDKHRSLKLFVAGVAKFTISYETRDCEVVKGLAPIRMPSLQRGVVVVALDVLYTGPNPELKANVDMTPGVAVEDAGEVGSTLTAIRQEVTEILHAPEITGALA
jgi:hypothetical protein